MPKKFKLKTHKATSKRFKMTGSGKIVRTKGPKGHFRTKQSRRSKHALGEMVPVATRGDRKRVKQLMPYIKQYSSKPSRPGSKSTK